MKIIKKVSKEELQNYLYNINLEDPGIYEEINTNNTIGIFQFNGVLASGITKQVKPRNFDEMVAINSLARPGTSSFVEDYIKGKEEDFSRYPKQVSELLKETGNICLFQEQLMSIFNVIGGFSLEETNNIRSLAKRLGKAEKSEDDLKSWEKAVKKLTKGAIEKGLSKEEAEFLAEDLLGMSSYQFNKSHAVSYSYVAIMTLYLSKYFKSNFLASVLQNQIEDSKDVLDAIQSIRGQGKEVLPPDINKSHPMASPVGEKNILLGISNIKKVSLVSANHILENRPYENLFDFILKTERKIIRVDVIKALVSVGAFDFETPERKRLLLAVDIFWKNKKSIKVEEKLKLIWDKAYSEAMSIKGLNITNSDLKEFENEYLGGNFFTSSFSNDLLSAFSRMRERNLIYYTFDEVTTLPKKVPSYIQNFRFHTDKNGNEMAFYLIEDVVGKTTRIPIFASFWKYIKEEIVGKEFCFFQLYRNAEGEIMFGSPRWVEDKREILRMVKTIN